MATDMTDNLSVLTLHTSSNTWGDRIQRAAGEPLGNGRWRVRALSPDPSMPFYEGDIVTADANGEITGIVRPSPFAWVMLMPMLEPMETDLMGIRSDFDHESRLFFIAEAVRDDVICTVSDGICISAVLSDADQSRLDRLEEHPDVIGVNVERWPNGVVRTYPNRVNTTETTKINMKWVREFAAFEHDEGNDTVWDEIAKRGRYFD